MRYSYVLKNSGKQVGWYECDLLDFKKMWKKILNDVWFCLVKLDNGDSWCWSCEGSREESFYKDGYWRKLNK